MQNAFIGARKRFCNVCPYSCCPTTRSEFAAKYRSCPEKLQVSAVVVNVAEDKVVGFVQMTEHGMPQPPDEAMLHTLREGECYIDMLSVSAEARGQGIGTKLLTWCERTARERGAKVLALGVVAGNPAKRPYDRSGFEDVPSHSRCCTSFWLFCFLGRPHGRCGATHMEKRLAEEEEEP